MKRKILTQFMVFGFLLGIYRGRIALWKDQDPKPIKVLPYSSELVQGPLRDALEKGIPISSMEDIELLLEKYLP